MKNHSNPLTSRRISRLQVRADESCFGRETFGPKDLRGTPDGFIFDAYGNSGSRSFKRTG